MSKELIPKEEIEKLKAEIQKQLAFHQGKVQQLIGGLGVCNVILNKAKKIKNG